MNVKEPKMVDLILTGEDSEWELFEDYDFKIWQNKRCPDVFKNSNGKAFYGLGKIFQDPEGNLYTTSESRVPITFPYSPHSIVIKDIQ